MSIDRSMPWLVFPPAVDLANTVVATGRGPVDLLATDEELDVWIDAERDRIPNVEAARGRLREVRVLRDAVHGLLHARARRERPDPAAIAGVNEASRASPAVAQIDERYEVSRLDQASSAWDGFRGVIARSAIELAGASGAALSECKAPSCGMLFLPDSGRQKWCSSSCGNRARVARHSARRRSAASR